MGKPDFFIVGAPRCGTTAMYGYLRRHPQIFMPEHKEPLYFGADLTPAGHGRLSESEYFALFKGARPGQRIGEASTWYLFSSTAAEEIHDFSPDAQIIIMLRDPVEVMHSLHAELVFYRAEPIQDFAEALAAEKDRKRGRRLGPLGRAEMLYYRDVVRFADQVERYIRVFGRDKVKVVLTEDFALDSAGVCRDVLRFLGVDDAVPPNLRRVNESKRVFSSSVQELIVRPPRPIAQFIPLIRRVPLAHQLRARLLRLNSRSAARVPLSPQLRDHLRREYAAEIERLGDLIKRELSHWSRTEPSSAADSVAIPIDQADRSSLEVLGRMDASMAAIRGGENRDATQATHREQKGNRAR